ncbi:alanine racemase [Nesterenkonia muleiensis]|uniref:alanine racemase n=1 Tax=Nesterenkonia muleiensis TaxID=2282648 RepID=UPI0013904925|nr:alanine racemase [Nesterenkonia muleiensis]
MIDAHIKGYPLLAGRSNPVNIGEKGWNVLRQDLPLPIAVLKESALSANSKWMSDFSKRSDFSLAPHGKTTMCPQIFQRQLDDGAWAITLSTAHQVAVARDFGVNRVLLANQIMDPQFLAYLYHTLLADPSFEFYCLIDSIEGAQFLDQWLTHLGGKVRLQVLIEVGVPGGRTGVRDAESVEKLAQFAISCSNLVLRGIEGFEGLVPGACAANVHPVREYLDKVIAAVRKGLVSGWFTGEAILSLGGSAYFDVVQDSVASLARERLRIVLRSGCYIAQDNHLYEEHFRAIRERSALANSLDGGLQPALEVLAYVQSIPEPGVGVLAVGRRDLSYDNHLPIPLRWHRPGSSVEIPRRFPPGTDVKEIYDQHVTMNLPPGSTVATGDIVALGISHPCTTFDKWRYLFGVDESYSVVSAYETFF